MLKVIPRKLSSEVLFTESGRFEEPDITAHDAELTS